MHLGNICTALLAWLSVRSSGGEMLLRIEDLDTDRCRPEYSELLIRDLEWLGLDWDEGPYAERGNGPYYQSLRGENKKDSIHVFVPELIFILLMLRIEQTVLSCMTEDVPG